MNQIQIVAIAVKAVFKEKKFLLSFIFLTFLSLWFFIYIPVKKIPGNTFLFQISIFTLVDWFLLVILSILTALSLVMNFFVIKNDLKKTYGSSTLRRGGFSVLSGIIGSIFGPTASCASCVGSIFGFLGVGGVFFLLQYRFYIVIVSIVFMLLSLYYTSLRILGVCNIKFKI